MERSIKVGDRFAWNKERDDGYIYELEWTGDAFVTVKQGPLSNLPMGSVYIKGPDLNPYNWDYIGNFSKPDKFEQLYNLLNDTQDR